MNIQLILQAIVLNCTIILFTNKEIYRSQVPVTIMLLSHARFLKIELLVAVGSKMPYGSIIGQSIQKYIKQCNK